METKKCTKCGEVKGLEEFRADPNASNGVGSRCLRCDRTSSKAWYEANRSRHLARQKGYREANKAALDASRRTYREANRDRICDRKRKVRKENPDKFLNSDSAVRKALRTPDPPPELIELKRQQLILRRLTKQLNKTIEEKEQQDVTA